MSTFVLWDIDGTLIENSPPADTPYLDAVEHVTGVRPAQGVDVTGRADADIVAELLAAGGHDAGRLGEVLFDLDGLSREAMERGWDRDGCPGVPAALQAIAERGWVNALITGNGADRARYKLLTAGFDPADFDWNHSYFAHESPTRGASAATRTVLTEHTMVLVGDTPNDARTAESAGIPFVAVATGVYPAELLHRTAAVAVIDDLEAGLDALLDAVAAAESAGASDDSDAGSLPVAQEPVSGEAAAEAETPVGDGSDEADDRSDDSGSDSDSSEAGDRSDDSGFGFGEAAGDGGEASDGATGDAAADDDPAPDAAEKPADDATAGSGAGDHSGDSGSGNSGSGDSDGSGSDDSGTEAPAADPTDDATALLAASLTGASLPETSRPHDEPETSDERPSDDEQADSGTTEAGERADTGETQAQGDDATR